MLYTNIIAQITSKLDFSGVWCLAAIPCIIIVLFAYSKGPWSGSCTCLIFFVISIFATGDLGDSGSGATNITPNPTFIANRSQTKMIERYKYSINDSNCIFSTPQSRGFGEDTIFIPAEEMYVDADGWRRMKSTGEKPDPFGEDGYLYDETIAPANAPTEAGGYGVPQWLYHPAAPTWIFGIAGAPALLGGMFIASRLRG